MSKLPVLKSQMLPPMDDASRPRSKLRQPTVIRKTTETTTRNTSRQRSSSQEKPVCVCTPPPKTTGLGTRLKQVSVRHESPGDSITGQSRVVREKSVTEVIPSRRSVMQERVSASTGRRPGVVRQKTFSETTRRPELEELKKKEILAARITARKQAAQEERLKAAQRRTKVTVSKTKIAKPGGSRTVIRETTVKPKAGSYRIPMQYTRADQEVICSSPGELREQLRSNLPLDLEYNWRDKQVPTHPDLDYYRERDVQSGSVYYGPVATSEEDEFLRRIPGAEILEQRIDRTQTFDDWPESDKSSRRSPRTPRRCPKTPIRSPRTPRFDETPPAWSPFSYKSSVGSPERDIFSTTPPNWDEFLSDIESVRSPRTPRLDSSIIAEAPRSPIRSPRTPRFDDTPPAWSSFSYKSSAGSPERDIFSTTPPNWDVLSSDTESVSFKKSPRRSPRTPRLDSSIIAEAPRRSPIRSPRTPRFDGTPPAWSSFSYKSSAGSPERDIFATTPPNWDVLSSDTESVSFKKSPRRSPRTPRLDSSIIAETPRRSPIRSPRTPRFDGTPPAWSSFSYKSSAGSPERDIFSTTPPNWDVLSSDTESVSFKKSPRRSPRTPRLDSSIIAETPRRSPIRSPRTPRLDGTPPAWSSFSYKSSAGSPERDIFSTTPPNWDVLSSDTESVSFKKSPRRSPRTPRLDSSIIAEAPRRSPIRSPRTPRLDGTPPAWSSFSYKSSTGSPERDIFTTTPPNWDELPSDAESVSFKKSPRRSPRTSTFDSSIIAEAPRRSPIRSPRTPRLDLTAKDSLTITRTSRRSPVRSPRTPRLDATPPQWSPFSYKSCSGSPESDISNISAPLWADVSSGEDSFLEKSVTHSTSAAGDDVFTVTEKITEPSKETIISTSTITPKKTPGNDPRLVKQLIEEENEDVDIAMNLMPMELVSFKPEKYVLRRKLNQMRAQSRSMVILEESSRMGVNADDPTEEMQPEVAAAIMHTEEKGLTLGSPPTRIYNYLFPESGEPVIGVSSAGPAPLQDVVVPISSPSAQQRSTINSEFEKAVIITQSTSHRPHTHIYSESGRNSWRIIKSPKKSKKSSDDKDDSNLDNTVMSELIGAAPSSTRAEAQDMPSVESPGLEYLLIPEPPRHSNKVQLRGSTLPPWFPGYYMAFPEFSETVRMTQTPSVAIIAAWKMMKPAAFPENSRFVV